MEPFHADWLGQYKYRWLLRPMITIRFNSKWKKHYSHSTNLWKWRSAEKWKLVWTFPLAGATGASVFSTKRRISSLLDVKNHTSHISVYAGYGSWLMCYVARQPRLECAESCIDVINFFYVFLSRSRFYVFKRFFKFFPHLVIKKNVLKCKV